MEKLSSFKDVIDRWPSRKDFAADIQVSVSTVHKMHELDSIRGVYFHRIAMASRQRHPYRPITAEALCRLAEKSLVERDALGGGAATATPQKVAS